MRKFFLFCFILSIVFHVSLYPELYIGVASKDITPKIGTPSAGYISRNGVGMKGVKDPLLASAMVIKNEKNCIDFCSVDNLGFDQWMVMEIRRIIQQHSELSNCQLFVGASHTHNGGGAYIYYRYVGEALAGKFNSDIRKFYIDETVKAILDAATNMQPAKIGIGYGTLTGMNYYRGKNPTSFLPRESITVIKATTLDEKLMGLIFNFTANPTILSHNCLEFSADFVGSTRKFLEQFGENTFVPIFFNGAQGDVNPSSESMNNDFDEKNCNEIGFALAEKVWEITDITETKDTLDIANISFPYIFYVKVSKKLSKVLPKRYASELNVIVLDKIHAFLTIPGELSCVYDYQLRNYAQDILGFKDLTIFGLTNDAHGYMLLPEAWGKDPSAKLSFGERGYGNYIYDLSQNLILEAKQLIGENNSIK